MKILIINSGSSSIKFQVLEMPSEILLCSGLAERIGSEESSIKFATENMSTHLTLPLNNHREGLQKVVGMLTGKDNGVIRHEEEIVAVGHRVVHGGDKFSKTTVINDMVKEEVRAYSALAPLHNPPNLEGILVAEEFFPLAKQVAVFDTAFHQTIPQKARRYAIPADLYSKYEIQVYGFHGISHQYVSQEAIRYLGLQQSKMITIHLGNGCSMTAVVNGKSVDHSMGFSPSNGLVMGSRSGDIDHGIIFHLVNNLGYSLDEVNTLLTKESGMLGLTGYLDLRDIEWRANKGHEACKLALEINSYRVRKYIGSYAAAMNGLDVVVFTAGIGENSTLIRKMVCSDMEFCGIILDDRKNEEKVNLIREIQSIKSKVKVLVIPTNEELEMANQVYGLLSH